MTGSVAFETKLSLTPHVWHITHRCHQRKFLLKFARDRRRYLYWLFEAKKRFGLSVLGAPKGQIFVDSQRDDIAA
jgi:hypothetical protein